MHFPSSADELKLHERVLRGDPVATADVFMAFMDPILSVLEREVSCTREEAYDSAVDAVFSYLQEPARYATQRGRLSTYLTRAAKYRALDRHRSTAAQARREQDFAGIVELQARTPKEKLETTVEAGLALEKLVKIVKNQKDLDTLQLVMQGERSTERLAEVLGLASLPKDEKQQEVKRHRDRLMKLLERFGKEGSHGEP